MDVKAIVAALEARYPGKPIVLRPADTPTQIMCEFMRGEKRSAAAVVMERSTPHYFKTTAVGISVSRGPIDLYVDGQKRSLKSGETEFVHPGQVHYIESRGGEPAWLIVVYTPPWAEEDEILVVPDIAE